MRSGRTRHRVVLAVAMGTIGKLCLLCLSTDVLVVTWFIAVVPLAVTRTDDRRAAWWGRRGTALACVVGALLVAVAGGTWAALRGPVTATTVADVEARDPKFYHWYTQLPVRPTITLT